MAHPKRRQSSHRQGIRRSHLGITPTQINSCGRCGEAIKQHTVCDKCGYYGFSKGSDKKGRVVFEREDF